MFDIAAVQQVYGDNYIISDLSAFPDDVALAQNIAEQMKPGLAQGVLSGLTVRADFFDLIKTAQASVIELLSRVPR
jgi:hypothetical protein